LIATASLIEKAESTVTTLPFIRIHSAGGRGSKNDCATSRTHTRCEKSKTKNSRRGNFSRGSR
jgi:hypothetical protein